MSQDPHTLSLAAQIVDAELRIVQRRASLQRQSEALTAELRSLSVRTQQQLKSTAKIVSMAAGAFGVLRILVGLRRPRKAKLQSKRRGLLASLLPLILGWLRTYLIRSVTARLSANRSRR